MEHPRAGQVAVIFISRSSGSDEAAYAAAADRMAALAAQQPGYRGVDWVGDAEGGEITISYWADDARVQDEGRGTWLQRYDLMVADVRRGHMWER